jgi:hypothetical protein
MIDTKLESSMKIIFALVLAFGFSFGAAADVKQRMIEISLAPDDSSKAQSILPIVRFPVIEGFSGWISEKKELTEQEAFIKRMVETYSSSDSISGIEPLWDSRSFDNLRQLFSTSGDLFQQNANYYKEITDSRVTGVIVYGDYEIVFAEHKMNGNEKPRERQYPTLLKEDGRVLSNEVTDDAFYQYILHKIRPQLLERW